MVTLIRFMIFRNFILYQPKWRKWRKWRHLFYLRLKSMPHKEGDQDLFLMLIVIRYGLFFRSFLFHRALDLKVAQIRWFGSKRTPFNSKRFFFFENHIYYLDNLYFLMKVNFSKYRAGDSMSTRYDFAK